MQIVPSLLGAQPYITWPNHLLAWLGWLALAFVLGWGLRHWWEGFSDVLRRRWAWLVALVLATPLTTSLLGLRLPGEILPIPVLPVDVVSPALMFLSAVPWVLAAGLLGPLPAVVLAILSGLLLANFETHSIFTPLELGGLALLFSVAVRQNYRTWFFHLLRHPLGAGFVVMAGFLPVMILSSLLATNGSLAVRLDFAFSHTWFVSLARAGELLIAGLFAELIYLLRPDLWGRRRALQPSPSELSIQARFFYSVVPLVTLLVLTLIIGDWLVAGNAARRMIRERLSSTAEVAADSLPYFIETGQNLILTLSGPQLLELRADELGPELAIRLRSVPYFRQLYLFDGAGTVISGYPANDFEKVNPTKEEVSGIRLAIKGVTTQTYLIPPVAGETSAQVSFLAAIRDDQGVVQGVLLGRTDFNTNPFTQPAIQALNNLTELGGEGMILSEDGIILYHPSTSLVMSTYLGSRPATAAFFDEISPRNTRRYVFYQPVIGRPWAVVLTVPAQFAQQIALEIAIPLLVMLLVFSTLAFILLRLMLRTVTASLKTLSVEASFISQGQLDRPLPVNSVDEIGRLSTSFEQMRLSLKARLDELNRLLYVSQGVAANLDINEAVRPVLEAALANGASAARVVFVREVTLDTNEGGPVAFGIGPAAQVYAGLDMQLFELARQQDQVNLPNVARTRRLHSEAGQLLPGALLAVAIRHDSRYYGAFWIAYDRARGFSEEEVRFITTLAGQAALAATSARLYATSEVGRQRLEAVLASTPEPVLVIDAQARLLLLNPAAVQVPGLILSAQAGSPIQDVVGPQEVVDMLMAPLTERISSREITLPNGKVYYASVSSVLTENRPMGRVCILRDITHFKELEQLKSDFVATVSHDLRSPLTLMRGYATMLQMVGDLNDQQKNYVQKVVGGVENMTRLVNNLLDLGRIEAGIGLQIEKVSVSEVSDEVINSLQLQAVQKDIRLTHEISVNNRGFLIEADRALIQQAMYNLVENAIKYTQVGGHVIVRLEARPATILMEVQDTGIGIAPLDLPHVFEKFYRSGRREAYQQRGTGLGLAIVKSIAERHGGRVWVDSQLGKGSVFSLEVPCEQTSRVQIEIS